MNTSETVPTYAPLSEKGAYPSLIFKYTLTYSVAFAIGMILWYAVGFEVGEAIDIAVKSRFSGVFSKCSTFEEYFQTLLRCSASDIRHLMLAFAAGFTMLAGAALTALLLFRGISLGLSTAYLLSLIRSGSSDISALRFGIYLCLCALIAASVICFCAHSTIFSEKFRELGKNRLKIISSTVFWRQIYAFLLTLGFAVIMGLLNCL